MALHLGDTVPNFTAPSSIGEINFYDFLGDSWGVFFSHPADYTPVCTTELGRTAALKGEFEKRNVKAIALSVDPVESHTGWMKDIEETQGCAVDYPIISDVGGKIAEMYDMIHPKASGNQTVRALYVISPDKKLKLSMTYPASTGRNFLEVIRVIDSLQLAAEHNIATPADWKPGEDVIIPTSVSTEDAEKKFEKGVKVVKPYLRYTPAPDKK